MPLTGWLVDRVARIPTRVQTKLLAAFLAIAALLIMAGAVGLQALRGVNERTEELIHLQRKIEAYRQVQHDTTSQLYSVSSALLSSDDSTLSSTLRHLNQFGYDADRLQFVAKDEVDLLEEFQRQYGRFVEIVTHVVELIRAGRAGEARELQVTQATPLADRLERLTNQLVNKAEADMVAGIDARTQAYETARWIVIAFALGSIALALGLGYAISWSLVGPVKEIEAKLNRVATGDFTQRVEVANRDELGALAANVNRMSEELGRLYQQLELASKHKSQFLANMSHELRTPLNAILGYAELMVDGIYGEPSERMRGVLERLQSNGRHLLGLINAVLDLSKIEAGQLTLSINDYSLKEVVQSVFVAVESLATAKRLALKIELPAALPPGRGDEQRITQVLLNLVGNAIKFTARGGVRLSVSPLRPGVLLFAVEDTGIGIPAEKLDPIFDPFTQADGSHTRRFGGTGLGLAISQRLVNLMGGRLWAESTVGVGSCFAFELPLAPRRRPVAAPVAVQEAPEKLTGIRVLVAEDNIVNQKVISAMLARQSWEYVLACNGKEAVERYREQRFDLILMDVQMPEIDGLEATQLIRHDEAMRGDSSHVPIVALTAHVGESQHQTCRSVGMDGVLTKPISVAELVKTVTDTLKSRPEATVAG